MPRRSRVHYIILPTLAADAEYLLFTHIYILQSRIRKPVTGGRPYFQQGNSPPSPLHRGEPGTGPIFPNTT